MAQNKNADDDYDESDFSEQSVDSCEEFIDFESVRNPSTRLEEAIRFSWPGTHGRIGGSCLGEDDESDEKDILKGKHVEEYAPGRGGTIPTRRRIVLSTLLEENDLAPLFDGSRWAGTRLWGAAVRCIQYLSGRLPDGSMGMLEIFGMEPTSTTMLELGCGLGVPGMIFHMLGGDVVLTDQSDILSQLERNVIQNFPLTAIASVSPNDSTSSPDKRLAGIEQRGIRAMPLSWSRDGVDWLLQLLRRSTVGFDIVINCDCVYEPLYGTSWHQLNEAIDELLHVNPRCLVVSSMERRQADGIDDFLEEMRGLANVADVDRVWVDKKRRIEIYLTRGMS